MKRTSKVNLVKLNLVCDCLNFQRGTTQETTGSHGQVMSAQGTAPEKVNSITRAAHALYQLIKFQSGAVGVGKTWFVGGLYSGSFNSVLL